MAVLPKQTLKAAQDAVGRYTKEEAFSPAGFNEIQNGLERPRKKKNRTPVMACENCEDNWPTAAPPAEAVFEQTRRLLRVTTALQQGLASRNSKHCPSTDKGSGASSCTCRQPFPNYFGPRCSRKTKYHGAATAPDRNQVLFKGRKTCLCGVANSEGGSGPPRTTAFVCSTRKAALAVLFFFFFFKIRLS